MKTSFEKSPLYYEFNNPPLRLFYILLHNQTLMPTNMLNFDTVMKMITVNN